MSIILNIDTSLEIASVALSKAGQILNFFTNAVQKEHAVFLHKAIQELLAIQQLQPNQIDAIAVTNGPGSYTGLRVGLSAAKGLCYALNKPLISMGTLEVMATDAIMQIPNIKDCLFCPMIDARRMEVFTALYDSNLQEIMPASAIVLDNQSFQNILETKKIYFFGSGMQKWKNFNIHDNAAYIENNHLYNAMNTISFKKYLSADFANTSYVSPLYVKEFYNP
jgi:tRNA threonylcarbamoyladenosine biosynthesis protein TsaB